MAIYENVDKALEAIKKISLSKGAPMYYRGQRKNYPISSSIHRLSSDEIIDKEADKTGAFIKWIKAQNALLPSVVTANDSLYGTDLIYWAIAQHYGYKTDLIDFTTSLEIATAFSLLGRTIGDIGVIYCFWEDDIQDIADLYYFNNSSIDRRSRELLESVDYNPFFTFQIEELSRITNQNGLFLWDLHAIISSHWIGKMMSNDEWVDTHCYYFYQTDVNIDICVLRKVYPEPNYVEVIIDQFIQVENYHSFYKNYEKWFESIEKIDPLSTNSLAKYFAENDFSVLQKIFYHEGNVFFPRDGMETLPVDIDLSLIEQLESETASLCFIESWLSQLNKNKYLVYTSTDPITKLYSEIINEVLSLVGLFPAIISKGLNFVLQKALSILGSLLIIVGHNSPEAYVNAYNKLSEYQFNLNDSDSNIEQILDILREQVCLNDIATDVWGGECVFLKIIGCNDIISFGVLPLQYVNELTPEYKKQQLETLQFLFEKGDLPATQIAIPKSGKIYRTSPDKASLTLKDLFNYVSKPTVLFNASDMLSIMLHCFIPWQIVMCPKRTRLYNPLEYKEIRLMESENIPHSKLFYWRGAYISVVDENNGEI